MQRDKARMRRELKARRAALPGTVRAQASRALMGAVIAHRAYSNALVVALYSDFRDEVETSALLGHALSMGKRVVLPRVERDGTMSLREITSVDELEVGAFGIREPMVNSPVVAVEQVDLFLIPGLAFDRHGGRLGYGRGYYDRLLAAARADSVWMGMAFSCQWVDMVPSEPHDVRLHFVATEQGIEPVGDPNDPGS